MPTSSISDLSQDISLFVLYIPTTYSEHTLNFTQVFNLYCSLKPGITVKDFCQEHDTPSMGIDDRRFIMFGVINGLLRR